MIFSIPPEKAAKWQASIEDVLRAGHLTPADAAKLAGKLGWGASAVFGRGARVYLAPLFHWSTGRRTILTTRLKKTLEWWQRFLAATPQRNIPLRWRAKPRILVYSDATGGGRRRASRAYFSFVYSRGARLAWVIDDGCQRRYAAAEVPAALRRWVVRRKVQAGARARGAPGGRGGAACRGLRVQVATWELVAALCAIATVLSESDEVEIISFIDSAVALGTLLRGASRQPDWNALVGQLWLDAARQGCPMWAFRVPSAQNPADAPTRPTQKWRELQAMQRAGFSQEAWQWPTSAPWC